MMSNRESGRIRWVLAVTLLALPAGVAQAQWSLNGSRPEAPAGRAAFVPKHRRTVSHTVVDGTILEAPEAIEPAQVPHFEGDCDSCGDWDCDGACYYGPRVGMRCRWLRFPLLASAVRNMQYFAGVEGFVSPRYLGSPTRGQDGSFGFQEGINWGMPFPLFRRFGIGTQLGARLTQANFSGASFTADNRSQVFLTGGFFRRVDCGLQAGIVLDYLQDEWYAEMELTQMRAEVSWVRPCFDEFGFTATAALDGDTSSVTTVNAAGARMTTQETWNPVDIYGFFYRRHLDAETGANWRITGGVSGEQDGLVGFDFTLPASGCWALQGGFSYLIPKDTNNQHGSISEDWAIGLNLVWHPAGFANPARRYLHPLFEVAGNRSLFITRE